MLCKKSKNEKMTCNKQTITICRETEKMCFAKKKNVQTNEEKKEQ